MPCPRQCSPSPRPSTSPGSSRRRSTRASSGESSSTFSPPEKRPSRGTSSIASREKSQVPFQRNGENLGKDNLQKYIEVTLNLCPTEMDILISKLGVADAVPRLRPQRLHGGRVRAPRRQDVPLPSLRVRRLPLLTRRQLRGGGHRREESEQPTLALAAVARWALLMG